MEFIEPSLLIILALVAFLAGFIDAVAGGGGMLTVPALLSLGLPPHIALGTNKLAATFSSSVSTFAYYRQRLFQPQRWKRALAATLLGAILGTLFVDWISTAWLDKVLPLVILIAAVYTLFHKTPTNTHAGTPPPCATFHKRQYGQGLILGFYDGMAGPGTGAFWTVSSMALHRMTILLASGMSKAMTLVSNATSLVTFALLGHIDWVLGLTMGICLMAGAWVGAHSAIRFGANFIRPIFIGVVTLLAIKLAYDAWIVHL